MGNISAVYEDDELVCRYEYDSLNRLIREDNKAMDMSVLFTYDKNGNITSRRTYAYTTTKTTAELEDMAYTKKDTYLYDGDRLISYNDLPFAYDELGNIIAMLDNQGAAVVQYKYDAWGSKAKTIDNCFHRSERLRMVEVLGIQGWNTNQHR